MASQLQTAASFFYHWFNGSLKPEQISNDKLNALQNILGSPLTANELIQFGEKIHSSEGFKSLQKQIADQWQHLIEPTPEIDDQQAQRLLQQISESIDHSLIFNHNIIASMTHTEQGDLSDREKRFAGTMPCWTLHLTTLGSALFLNEQMEINVAPGDLMLFHPEASYHYGRHPADSQWQHLWALFQPRAHWQELLNWTVLDKGILHLSINDSNKQSNIEGIFRKLIDLKNHPSRYQTDLQYNCLEELLIRAKESQSSHSGNLVDHRIKKACDYINNHLAQPFNVEDVARECNLSPSRIAHLFKQHMGVSLKYWANNIRLQKARKLLLQSNDSINQVAKQIGYNDPAQFAKSFKNNMGCSPRDFRQSFKS